MADEIMDALLDAPTTEPEATPDAAPDATPDATPDVEPVAAPEPEAETTPAPEADETKTEDVSQEAEEFDSGLLMRAKQIGLDEAAARRMGADVLGNALGQWDGYLMQHPLTPPKAPAAAPVEAPKAPPAAAKPEGFAVPEELLNGDMVDPIVGNTIKGLAEENAALREQVTAGQKTLESKFDEVLEAVRGADQKNAENKFHTDLDEAFSTLGEEWKAVFGVGDIRNLPQDEADNRRKIAPMVTTLIANYRQLGYAEPEMKRAVMAAATSVFADKLETVSRQKIAGKLKEREGAMLPRPKPRKSEGLSLKDEAKADIRKIIQRKRDADEGDDFRESLLE